MDAAAEDDFREFVLARTPSLLGTAFLLTGDRYDGYRAVVASGVELDGG